MRFQQHVDGFGQARPRRGLQRVRYAPPGVLRQHGGTLHAQIRPGGQHRKRIGEVRRIRQIGRQHQQTQLGQGQVHGRGGGQVGQCGIEGVSRAGKRPVAPAVLVGRDTRMDAPFRRPFHAQRHRKGTFLLRQRRTRRAQQRQEQDRQPFHVRFLLTGVQSSVMTAAQATGNSSQGRSRSSQRQSSAAFTVWDAMSSPTST